MNILTINVPFTSTVTFVILINDAEIVTIPPAGTATPSAVAGDLIRAFNSATFDPNDLNNGALYYSHTLEAGCGWLWFMDDFVDYVNVTEVCPPEGECENAVVCDCEPIFQVEPPDPPPPPIVYTNTEQCATAICPSGSPGSDVTVCKAAGLFTDTSQSGANNQAYAAALAEANASLNCGLSGQLNGLVFLMPATTNTNPCGCVDPVDQTAVAVGNPAQTYSVWLRIRGLVELKPYAFYGLGGGQNNAIFLCTNPTQAIPAVPAHGDNEYSIYISDPPATYMLNNSTGAAAPTRSTVVDYQLNVFIKTGATITLKARSIDNLEWNNPANAVVNSAPPTTPVSEPYSGQWMELIVLSIF